MLKKNFRELRFTSITEWLEYMKKPTEKRARLMKCRNDKEESCSYNQNKVIKFQGHIIKEKNYAEK